MIYYKLSGDNNQKDPTKQLVIMNGNHNDGLTISRELLTSTSLVPATTAQNSSGDRSVNISASDDYTGSNTVMTTTDGTYKNDFLRENENKDTEGKNELATVRTVRVEHRVRRVVRMARMRMARLRRERLRRERMRRARMRRARMAMSKSAIPLWQR